MPVMPLCKSIILKVQNVVPSTVAEILLTRRKSWLVQTIPCSSESLLDEESSSE